MFPTEPPQSLPAFIDPLVEVFARENVDKQDAFVILLDLSEDEALGKLVDLPLTAPEPSFNVLL